MNKFICDFKNMNFSINKLMKLGIKSSFVSCLFFTYILYFYTFNPFSHLTFEIGYLGVKCCFMLIACFFGIAIVTDKFLKLDLHIM